MKKLAKGYLFNIGNIESEKSLNSKSGLENTALLYQLNTLMSIIFFKILNSFLEREPGRRSEREN